MDLPVCRGEERGIQDGHGSIQIHRAVNLAKLDHWDYILNFSIRRCNSSAMFDSIDADADISSIVASCSSVAAETCCVPSAVRLANSSTEWIDSTTLS